MTNPDVSLSLWREQNSIISDTETKTEEEPSYITPEETSQTMCYNFSYFVLFTYVFSLLLEVSHGTAALTHFSLTHIAATLLTHSIAILIALPHWYSIYSGQFCRLFSS